MNDGSDIVNYLDMPTDTGESKINISLNFN